MSHPSSVITDHPSVRQNDSNPGVTDLLSELSSACQMDADGPGVALPTAMMTAAAPPPYHGSIMMFWTLMGSPLRERFRLVHLDISDHRTLENIGRLDIENVRLGIKHALDCYRTLKRERPEVVYVPVAMNPLAFFRDSVFLVLARAFRWREASAARRKLKRDRGNRSLDISPLAPRCFNCVIHAHGSHFDDFYRSCPAPFRAYIRWCLKGVDAAVVLSEALRPMFAGLMPEERVWPVSNGIAGVPDHLRFAPRQASRAPTVLFLGNLIEWKGFLDVMAAAPLVAKAAPGVRFVIAGPYCRAQDREQAARLLQDPEIRAVVELPGAVTGDARFELMMGADIFVFPSYNEGQPTVILEAMSAGLPVVTTDEGAIRDTIVDGETGFLVPKGDPEAIARKTVELLRDEPLRRRMGAAGRRRFEERFRVDSYGEAMARVFEAVLYGERSVVGEKSILRSCDADRLPHR